MVVATMVLIIGSSELLVIYSLITKLLGLYSIFHLIFSCYSLFQGWLGVTRWSILVLNEINVY